MVEIERSASLSRGQLCLSVLAWIAVFGLGVFWAARPVLPMVALSFVSSVALVGTLLFVGGVYKALRLPSDAASACDAAMQAFRKDFPHRIVVNTAIRSVSGNCYLVSVRYERGMPLPREYYEVRRGDLAASLVEGSAHLRPRGLK